MGLRARSPEQPAGDLQLQQRLTGAFQNSVRRGHLGAVLELVDELDGLLEVLCSIFTCH